MKYPNHILLDINKKNNLTNQSWINLYETNYSNISLTDTYIKTKIKTKSKKFLNNNFTVNVQSSLNNKQIFNLHKPIQIFNSLLWNLFDINFIKKERIYTKLKYSRSPQYDIVSGGVAALFSGFLGFLISEKFGIELVDSGDFYTGFMYCVFLSFSLRPFLKVLTKNGNWDKTNPKNVIAQKTWNFFSLKYLLEFFNTFLFMVLRTFKQTFNSLFFIQNFLNNILKNEYISDIYNKFKRIIRFLKNYPRDNFKY